MPFGSGFFLIADKVFQAFRDKFRKIPLPQGSDETGKVAALSGVEHRLGPVVVNPRCPAPFSKSGNSIRTERTHENQTFTGSRNRRAIEC